jgi:hypothetical protein
MVSTYNREILTITKETMQKQKEAMEEFRSAMSRKFEALDIQKDLLNSIGAPFEMILGIEQQIVDQKRVQAEYEQKMLDSMIASGADAKVIEEQKLKTAKAQADVLKSAFGAQRDSLDKMLGKMMGTFNQIGGIFGTDSSRMLSRKYGQGYG